MFQQNKDNSTSENQKSGEQQPNSNTTQSFEPPSASVANENILTEPMTQYPLSDEAYDIVSLLYHKSKALPVYDKYLKDLREDNQIRNLLIQIKQDEERHIQGLKNHLGRLLYRKGASSSTTTGTTSPGD